MRFKESHVKRHSRTIRLCLSLSAVAVSERLVLSAGMKAALRWSRRVIKQAPAQLVSILIPEPSDARLAPLSPLLDVPKEQNLAESGSCLMSLPVGIHAQGWPESTVDLVPGPGCR